MSDDPASAILNVLRRRPYQCIHTLMEKTGIPYNQINAELGKLEKKDLIEKHHFMGSAKLVIYRLIRFDPAEEESETCLPDHGMLPGMVSPTLGLTLEQARERVLMIKRMKSRLICDWHPILDILIRDYERDIGRVDLENEVLQGGVKFESGDDYE